MTVAQRNFGRIAAFVLTLGLVLLLLAGTASLYLAARTRSFVNVVTALQEARVITRLTLSQLQDAETGQRGYILTNKPEYLVPYTTARSALPDTLNKLQTHLVLLSDGDSEWFELRRLINAKLQELAETVDLHDRGQQESALRLINTDLGKELMDQARDVIEHITSEIDTRRRAERVALLRQTRWLLMATWAGLAAVLVVAAVSALVVVRALRESDRAQRMIRSTNEGLEQRVTERTEALASANEEIQRFAYIVSHDLRAPLVNVMGFTSELQMAMTPINNLLMAAKAQSPALVTTEARRAIEEDLPEAMTFIRNSTQRMDRLINAILKLSREGRRTLTPEHIDMAELMANLVGSVQHQLDRAGATAEIRRPMPDLTSDKLMVEQIFGNLIDNASKYLQSGRAGQITIGGFAEGALQRYEVRDNGRGIEARDHERVFELFRRAGVQDQPGEGIGLAHVRTVVRRLGGTIDFNSEPGVGTVFTVRLPKTVSESGAVT